MLNPKVKLALAPGRAKRAIFEEETTRPRLDRQDPSFGTSPTNIRPPQEPRNTMPDPIMRIQPINMRPIQDTPPKVDHPVQWPGNLKPDPTMRIQPVNMQPMRDMSASQTSPRWMGGTPIRQQKPNVEQWHIQQQQRYMLEALKALLDQRGGAVKWPVVR